MNDSELLENAEFDLHILIETTHSRGLNYWQILRLFLKAVDALVMKADCEWWMKQNK